MMASQKVVMPAQAGIQFLFNLLEIQDSRFLGNGLRNIFSTFCDFIFN
jgi:hypothetical protein